MRRVAFALVLGVLAASGAYALIYLFRWEWHRAIITALFFVAAEVGLGVSVVLRRIGRLEQQIAELADSGVAANGSAVDPNVLARIHESGPEPSKPFAWLDPRQSNLSVFLPFLLGVGALASGLAWIVEQLARRATAPVLERRLAQRLAPIAMPAGGLLSPAPVPMAQSRRGGRSRMLVRLVAAVAMLALSVATIDWLGDTLQTRPDERRPDVTTQIHVELRGARSTARPEQVAATLWGTCSHVLHGSVPAATIREVAGGRIQLTVQMHVGSHAEERLRGCLQDAVVDRVQATVVSLERVSAS
jgi:hypothetical protein